ncbi:MAG: ABC transporter ATP-binding protein, partial [Candidatus Pacebacteria bacterium]|nr:ABC transporter ATP-binding protein [Candidatus Paceibacterota bacterium]
MKPAISIQNLVKNYDSVEAVKRISFDIKNGEFFGLLGPNGAGKTTTINAITGLVNISSGNVNVFGQDVIKNYRETRKRIGLSQQDLMSLDRFLSVEEILTYQAGYFGIQKYEAQKRAEELLEHFDLASKRDVDIRKLSGGMKRRLSIAKALVHDPDILILDEPTAGLD